MELDIGLLFARICLHYGMSFREVMSLPMKTFWMLNKNINRLLAEQDIRALMVASHSQSKESIEALHKQLTEEFQNPYKFDDSIVLDEERDEAGFSELKMMALRG